ncbi:MAG: Maf family protein [Pseudomonadota bacterium]
MAVQLVLASQSPRRKELLERIGFTIRTIPADVPEVIQEGETPTEFVKRLAREKVLTVVDRLQATTFNLAESTQSQQSSSILASKDSQIRWVVGADTVVVLGDDLLGKPTDQDHAFDMLQRLSGREHKVITGFCIFDLLKNKEGLQAVVSTVRFKRLTRPEIEKYLGAGESLDKAGAYAVQGIGAYMIDSIQGSYTNVVGLPLCQMMEMLEEMGATDILPY